MHEFFILTCIYISVISGREIFYLMFYLYHNKGLGGNAWHSISHIVLLFLIPVICWHTVLFSESHIAVMVLLTFMAFTEYHMIDERQEYFSHMSIRDIIHYIIK